MAPYLGEIRLLPYSFAPKSWLDCDGSLVDITAQSEELFSLLGTTYGGDGVSNFGLPDLRGRVPLHQGSGSGLSSRSMGERGGSENVTLRATQMPAHAHGFNATSAAANAATPATGNQLGAVEGDVLYSSAVASASSSVTATMLAATGGDQPHDNQMPTLTVRFCIATQGIYPNQG